MSDGNNGNDELSIIDLVNDAIIADPDAVGLPSFEFFTARRVGIFPQFHHLILDTDSNRVG